MTLLRYYSIVKLIGYFTYFIPSICMCLYVEKSVGLLPLDLHCGVIRGSFVTQWNDSGQCTYNTHGFYPKVVGGRFITVWTRTMVPKPLGGHNLRLCINKTKRVYRVGSQWRELTGSVQVCAMPCCQAHE